MSFPTSFNNAQNVKEWKKIDTFPVKWKKITDWTYFDKVKYSL